MDTLHALADAGVAVWLDDLSRDRITSGNLADLVARGVVGVTTNPTIFAGALAHGTAYDAELRELAARGAAPEDAVAAITTRDVQDAADVLRPVYDRTGGLDGRVSLEVDPRLARDTTRTWDQAEQLWAAVDRPNLFIKIPATVEGLPAISGAIGRGISVNVTLIFSLRRYQAVLDAYATGLEDARRQGRDLATIGSVGSFFVSRVDTAVDALLDDLGTPAAAALRGRAAVANARLAYDLFQRWVESDRWQELADAGARPQRPLWASTGVKDPALPDTTYVDELVADGVVNTMPEKTLDAVADHGTVAPDAVIEGLADAGRTVDALAELGIDLEEVATRLEAEGVTKFEDSWTELLDTVRRGLAAAGETGLVG